MQLGGDNVPARSDVATSQVSRAMAITLRLSRIFGVAPVTLNKTNAGPYQTTARVSRGHAVYGYVLVSFLSILIFCCSYTSFKDVEDKLMIIMFLTSVSAMMLVTSIGTYRGFGRMTRMLRNLNSLKEIITRHTAHNLPNLKSGEKKQMRRVVISLVPYITLSLVTLLLEIFNTGFKDDHNILVLAYCVQFVMFGFIAIQITLMISAVGSALSALLLQIKQISTSERENPSNRPHVIENAGVEQKKKFEVICHLYDSYEIICKVVDDMNISEGALILILFTSFTFYTVFSLVNGIEISMKFSGFMFWSKIIVEISWIAMHVALLLTFIEVSHQAERRALEVRVTLSDLLSECLAAPNMPRSFKMSAYCDLLLLNRLVFAPLGVVELNRPLLTTVISFIGSCLVVIVQFKNSNI